MATYSGSGLLPYWMTVNGDGSHANPSAVSEDIPVQAGTGYSFQVTAEFASTFAGGVLLTLAFFTSAGSLISTAGSVGSGSMTGGVLTTINLSGTGVSSGIATAPSNSSYAVATLEIAGTPAAVNTLSVYQAEVDNNVNSLPVNLNYAFAYTTFPWAASGTGAVLGWQHAAFLAGDSDSLVLGGLVELMGGQQGVQCLVPELLDANGQGPTFRILAPPSLNSAAYGYESSYDLNAPQPTQDVVASMLLDGERPFGARASNRTISLPVVIFGTQSGGMAQVLKGREYLMQLIDQQIWEIKWTAADTGLPMIFDCFRALPSTPLYGFNYSAGGSATGQTIGRANYPIAMITLEIQALPYGRSDVDGVQSVAVENSLVNAPFAASGPTTVDTFSSLGTGTGWNLDTTTPPPNYIGHSVHWSSPRPVKVPYASAVYSRTLAANVSIAGLSTLSVQFGQSYDTQWPASPSYASNVTLYWTLTDNLGNTLKFSKAFKKVNWGANPTAPKWTQLNAAIPQGKVFNYGALHSYQVTVTNWSGSGSNGYVRMHCWLNNMVANPPTLQNQVSPRGNLYNLFALPGTARSPISVQCQLPAAVPVSKEISTPATGNWIVPPGVYSVQAEAWAAGGAGAATNLSRVIAGGGGGGGEYAQEPILSVIPGDQVPWSLGAGGTPGQLTSTVIQFTTPGLAHWTCPANVTTVLMEAWGGGGAGAAGSGGGGGGGYGVKQQAVTPGVTYYVWVATGGKADTGTSSAQNAARVGGNSYVASGPTGTYTNSVVSASGGNTTLTGSSSGGPGGDNTAATGTTHYNGGRGGAAPGPSGGGGGGAAGAAGPGGVGGDSQAFVPSVGHWQTGGISGQGSGQGGDGGAGANTPGFPGAGLQPGGGGGGGYQTSPLYNASNPSSTKPGTQTTNFLGGNGGPGMVQFTYAVGGGTAVSGSNTTFGSSNSTLVNGVGTIVTAHGGNSAANNSAAGGTGGTGSSNTIHANGGAGGLVTSGALASYISSPTVNTLLTFLKSLAYNSTTGTTAVSTASVAQGVAIALIESTAPVTDLVVTDSAGNLYQLADMQAGGSAGTGATAYAYVAPIEFAITTTTTLTATSATSQEYGILWYASPWLAGGVSTANLSDNNSTSSSFTSQFGVADTQSVLLELGVVVSDGSTTVSSLTQTKTWFNASTTNSLAAGTLNMAAYVMQNQGGGTDTGSGTGDVFSGSLSGSANWAALCIPLTVVNQQAAIVKMDWRNGTAPGAQTTWATEAAISANGMIMVIGQAGSGAGITAGPSAIGDAAGNTYTFNKTQLLPTSEGAVFIATAPVTNAMAAGTTGHYNWGTASAAPEYWTATYWIPNAVALDTNGVTAVTGSGTSVSGGYTPADPNDMLIGFYGLANTAAVTASAPAAPWNLIDTNIQSYLRDTVFASQLTDETAQTITETLSSTSPWALLLAGFQMSLSGTGGGAAGGSGGAGYPGVWQFGGAGYSGGGTGKGGSGGSAPAGNGGGAGTPGGGGGGALGSSAQAQEGGQGGAGMIRLTWNPPLQPFNTLIVHSLSIGSNPNVNPCCPIPITDQPNNTEYAIPSVNGLQPAAFSSSYTVLLINYLWDSATASSTRQITVSVNQYEFPGGPRSTVQVSRAITPASDVVNGIVNMGDVTLPVKDYSTFNDQSYFTVSINDTDLNDVFMDVLFLDTLGQTTLISIDPGNAGYGQYVNYFIDEATPDRDLGFIGASFQDRQHSISVMESALVSGGAPYIGPGDNLFFVYSTQGAPNLSVNYAPRWYLDRSQ